MQVSNPLQQVVLGVVGRDQFPVYDTDGFTKISGLDGTFVVKIFVNETLSPSYPTPTIVEIGTTGEYSISFQTLVRGRLLIEVDVAAHTFVWKGFYDIVDSEVLPGQFYYDVLRDRRGNGLPSVVVEVLASGTSTVLYTTQTDFDGVYVIPLSGSLGTRQLIDLRFSGGQFPTQTRVGMVFPTEGVQGPQGVPGPAFDSVSRTIYLSPTGDDVTGDGTAGAPYFSLNKASLMLPLMNLAGRTIDMAAGAYHYTEAQAVFSGIEVGPSSPPLNIIGKYTIVVSQRACTGATLPINTPGSEAPSTISAAALGVGVDELVGARLRMIDGPNAGERFTISRNTTTMISIAGPGFDGGISGGTPVPGNLFVIERPAVVVTIDLPLELHGPDAIAIDGVKIVSGQFGAVIQCNDAVSVNWSGGELDLASKGQLYVNDMSTFVAGGPAVAPFLDFQSGMYIHDGVTADEAIVVITRQVYLSGIFVLRNAGIDTSGQVELLGIDAEGSNFVCHDIGSYITFNGGQGRIDGGNINLVTRAQALIHEIRFFNTSTALSLLEACSAILRNVTGTSGTGISGYGIECYSASRVKLGSNCTVGGTAGDVKVQDQVASYATLTPNGGLCSLDTGARVEAQTEVDGKIGVLVAGLNVKLNPSHGRLDHGPVTVQAIAQLSAAAIAALVSPAEGLVVWDLTNHALVWFNGTIWKTVATV
jgi:hypothetical protein